MKTTESARRRWVAGIFEQYQGDLHRFLVRRLRAGQDSDDLAQEVYLRLLRLDRSEIVRKPQAYIYTIASHVTSQFRLRQEKAPVLFDSQSADEASEHQLTGPVDEVIDRLNSQNEVDRLLNLLPPLHRAVFVLCKRDGQSYLDIARQLNISVHTVKKYIQEAMVRIRSEARTERNRA